MFIYERIGSKILVGVYLAIYIKEDLVQHMSGLQAVVVPCGTPLFSHCYYLSYLTERRCNGQNWKQRSSCYQI